MCGRYTLTQDQEALQVALGVEGLVHPRPRFNIAPSQEAPVIRWEDGGSQGTRLRWGLIPSWARDPAIGNRLINARSETAHEKPSFRAAFRKGRCLVPADGFFEWKKGPGGKRPYWVHLTTQEPFTLAGLSEAWRSPEGEYLETFTILTTEAAPSIREIHHRMPVILPPHRREEWLDPATKVECLQAILDSQAFEDGEAAPLLAAREVSSRVNSPANDDPACLEPAPPPGGDLPLFAQGPGPG